MEPISYQDLLSQYQAESRSAEDRMDAFLDAMQKEASLDAEALKALEESFQTIVSQLRQYAEETASTRRARLRELLEDFLRVTSREPKFVEALAPLQEEAREALEASAGGPLTPQGDAWAHWAGLFFQAMDAPDDDSKQDALDSALEGRVNGMLARGLVRGKYFLPGAPEPPKGPETRDETSKKGTDGRAEKAPAKEREKPAVKAQGKPSEASEKEVGKLPSKVSAEEPPAEKRPTAEPPVETAAPGFPRESPAIETRTLFPVSKVKEAKLSANTFLDDLRHLRPVKFFVLPTLTHTGIMTAEQILRLHRVMYPGAEVMPAEDLIGALTAMCGGRSLLAAYAVGPSGEAAYCLTKYCVGSMRKQDVKKKLRRRWAVDPLDGEVAPLGGGPLPAAEALHRVEQNDLLLDYLEKIRQTDPERYQDAQGSLHYDGARYQVALPTRDGLVTVRLCRADETDRVDGPALCLKKEGASAAPAGALYCYDGLAWRWSGASWEDVTAPRTAPESGEGREPAAELAGDGLSGETPGEAAPEPKQEESAAEPAPNLEPAALEEEQEPDAEPPEEGLPEEPVWKRAQLLLDGLTDEAVPNEQDLQELIFALLDSGIRRRDGGLVQDELIQAVLLARCAGGDEAYPGCRKLYHQLLAATDLPLDKLGENVQSHKDYTGERLEELFGGKRDPRTEGLQLAACFRTMFAPGDPNDYDLRRKMEDLWEAYDAQFPHFSAVKTLFQTFLDIKDKMVRDTGGVAAGSGFTSAVLSYLGDEDQRKSSLKKMRAEARELLQFTRKLPDMKRTAPAMIQVCFTGPESDLFPCLKAIAEGADDQQVRQEIKLLLDEFYEADGELAEERLNQYINQKWRDAYKKAKVSVENPPDLTGNARRTIQNGIVERLELLRDWKAMTEESLEENSSALKAAGDKLCGQIPAALAELPRQQGYGTSVVRAMLERLLRKLRGGPEPQYLFADLLRTGQLSLDDAGRPVIDDGLCHVLYFEPWRRMLKHIAAEPGRGLEEVLDEIHKDKQSPCYNNWKQDQHIRRYLGLPDQNKKDTQEKEKARKLAKEKAADLQDKVELAYTYGRMDEVERETLLDRLKGREESFFELEDFGLWHQFLSALSRQLERYADAHTRRLTQDLENCRNGLAPEENTALLDRAEELLEERILAVAEEYIGRFGAGERELPGEWSDPDSTKFYEQFLAFDEASYKDLQNTYSGRRLRDFGVSYLEEHSPVGWKKEQEADRKKAAQRLFDKWPDRRNADNAQTAEAVKNLIELLGMEPTDAQFTGGGSAGRPECYALKMRYMPYHREEQYSHPIGDFGTMMQEELKVICILNRLSPSDMVNKAYDVDFSNNAIVLVDRAIKPGDRREIATQVRKKKAGKKSILVIDRTLMLFLATVRESERLPALLQCTLPYTAFQPFTAGSGSTSDEMFCGRVSELSQITDPKGPCVVYGGRQLGKTALLERAAHQTNDPKRKQYALCVSILTLETEEAVTEKIVGEIKTKLRLEFPDAKTLGGLDGLCKHLQTLFQDETISRFLLMLDEADAFLAAIGPQEYKPLIPLVDFQRDTGRRFRFVLAGLHNVFRAKHASSPNSIMGQLGAPLCIKPMAPMDARRLLCRPLAYLGFRFGEDLHIETILANTNYYPGVIQRLGYQLVLHINGHYGDYYHASADGNLSEGGEVERKENEGNPPFPLDADKLGAIMGSQDLNDFIQNSVKLTLNLDPRYFMLARCVAWLYYEKREEGDYSSTAKEIRKVADDWKIHCLEQVTLEEFTALLDELAEMGILLCSGDGDGASKRYRLRRYAFLNVIGKNVETLMEQIEQANGEEGEQKK